MLGLDGKPKMGASKGPSRAAKMDFLGLLFHTHDEIKILALFRADASETSRSNFPLLLRCSPESHAALPARFCQGKGHMAQHSRSCQCRCWGHDIAFGWRLKMALQVNSLSPVMKSMGPWVSEATGINPDSAFGVHGP